MCRQRLICFGISLTCYVLQKTVDIFKGNVEGKCRRKLDGNGQRNSKRAPPFQVNTSKEMENTYWWKRFL